MMTVEANRLRFEAMQRALLPVGDLPTEALAALSRIERLVGFAQKSGCGYYSSPAIERALQKLAATIDVPLASEVERGHCLMVMSEAYLVGGHTRVVERWVELDNTHRYSLVLTRQPAAAQLPDRLIRAVAASGGELLRLRGDDPMAKAAQLRSFASQFDKIILHIHTDDVVPVLAFGTEEFHRPVGLYNHADHLFWIGASVADKVGELRHVGIEFSRERRGIVDSMFIGIPVDCKDSGARMSTMERAELKKKLGMTAGGKIVVTCGNASKYDKVLGLDFMTSAEKILAQCPEAMLVGIGMTFRDLPEWRVIDRRLGGGRIVLMGPVPYAELGKYYAIADLVLDSYPFGGGAALPDALMHGCPVLSHPGPGGQMDWVYESDAFCRTDEELVDKAIRILRDEALGIGVATDESKVLRSINAAEAFSSRVLTFMSQLTGPHRLRSVNPRCTDFCDLDRYHLAMNDRRVDIIRPIPGFLELYYQYTPTRRLKYLVILGCRLQIKCKNI